MLAITAEQIADAVAGDINAAGEIVKELTPRIYWVARDAATVNGHLDEHMAEDFASEAKVAVLLCLRKFTGCTVGALSKFADRHISDAIAQARRSESVKGVVYDVSDHARRTFERAVSAACGDLEAAEALAQSAAHFGKNALSAEMAHRARLAAFPVQSLDAPQGDGLTLSETLAGQEAKPSRRPRTQYEERAHEILASLSPLCADILRHAAGIDGAQEFGMIYKRRANGEGNWTIKDAEGMAEELGTTVASVRSNWNAAKQSFSKKWLSAYGPRPDGRPSRTLTAKGAALVAAIEENDQHVFVKHHGRYVEFKHINAELDVVCTWTAKSRAVELGLLAA